MMNSRHMPRVVGYARVSLADPDLALQLKLLKGGGCQHILQERTPSTSPTSWKVRHLLMESLEAGDTLIVTRIDRLAASMRDLFEILVALDGCGAKLRALEQPIDTGTPNGQALVRMLAIFNELDAAFRRERQMEGVVKAKASGIYKGRRPTVDASRVLALHKRGKSPAVIANELRISKSSVYRLIAGGGS